MRAVLSQQTRQGAILVASHPARFESEIERDSLSYVESVEELVNSAGRLTPAYDSDFLGGQSRQGGFPTRTS